MHLLASGLSIREAASRLHRSVKTVASHRLAIGRKLGVRNQAQLTLAALRMGEPVRAAHMTQADAVDRADLASVLLELDASTSWQSGSAYLRQLTKLLVAIPKVQSVHILRIVHDRPFIVQELLASSAWGASPGRRLAQLPQCPTAWNNDGVRMWRIDRDPIMREFYPGPQAPPTWAISIELSHPVGHPVGWIVLCGEQFTLSAPTLAVLLRSCAQRAAHELQWALQAGEFREGQRLAEGPEARSLGSVELSLQLQGREWVLSACNKEALALTRGRILLHIGKPANQWLVDVPLLQMVIRVAQEDAAHKPATLDGPLRLLAGDPPFQARTHCRLEEDGMVKLTLQLHCS